MTTLEIAVLAAESLALVFACVVLIHTERAFRACLTSIETALRCALANPRALSRVPPPPMLVIHRGWLFTRITARPAEELAEEDRRRQGGRYAR